MSCPFHGAEAHAGHIAEGSTYGEILNVAPLLKLQRPLSPSATHDEMQYVIIHQVSELWFKLLLHELDEVSRQMHTGDLRLAERLLRRCRQILHLIDQGFGLMETMTAYDYMKFRPYLTGGSGFQSAQFREVEIALGLDRKGTINQPAFTDEERERIARRLASPSLWDSFVIAMQRLGYDMPDRQVTAQDPSEAERALQVLREMYVSGAHQDLRDLSEEIAALDNDVMLWRTHHAGMAERAIGMKEGTGGQGVEYLYKSARVRCFPELLAMRTRV